MRGHDDHQMSLRPTEIRTDESSSFRPFDSIGSPSSQSPESSAKAINLNLAHSTGSVVSLSKLSDSDLPMRSSQFRSSPIEIGGVVLLKVDASSFHDDMAE